ncbi:DNA adenine methylase [Candidatus Dojkabacteria bacterium]|jgi:site-specific DNA-adenine methylase|nr:DNA adenine methylase [Candidatus Dojkabacteria bacterium]
MAIMGYKNNKDIYKNLLKDLIPNNIDLYVEPFGGEFGLYEIMENKPIISIYNDINSELFEYVSNKYKNTICYNLDYSEIIKKYDNVNTFFYLDPPYYKKEFYYKNHNFLNLQNHIDLANILKNINGKFLLSYQNNDFIIDLYKDFNIYYYKGQSMFLKPEIAITNYEISKHNFSS